MPNEAEITHKLLKAIRSDRTIMLALAGEEAGDSQPMTALLEEKDDRGPLWIFSSVDVDLVAALTTTKPAKAQFVSKGHDVFAALDGALTIDTDRDVIDRLWSPFVAAWYKGGREDPKLRLLRFDVSRAHVWLNENSVFAMAKLLLGSDPKTDYKDKVADVRL